MNLLAESFFLTFLCTLYWLCRDRRRYLKGRIGNQAFKNVYRVGRNVFFMLRRNRLDVCGNLSILSKGCILYSFHFGIWELMPYTLCRLGYRMGIITNRYGTPGHNRMGRFLDYLLKRWRTINGIKVFYKENTMQIVRFIKSGGVFGMLVDGDSFFQKHERAKKLADLCRVPLVPFAAYRSGERAVLRIGCDIQDMVRAMPNDYVWFYKSRQRVP